MQILLHKFDSLDSTSSKAMQMLRAGVAQPIAIFARHQHAGRGRLGQQWLSTEEGLYLSIVIPAADLTGIDMRLLSIRAAVVVARFLLNSCHFRATLKWPNDLLFAGAKFGGILCESDLQGQVSSGVVIGIGLNLRDAPPLDDYLATHIAAVTGITYAPEALAEHFVDFFARSWCDIPDGDLLQHYAEFAIEAGQPWSLPGGGHAAVHGYGVDASLQLIDLQSKQVSVCSSAHSAGSWWYQSQRASPMVVADVGNSRTKFALFASVADRTPVLTAISAHAADVSGILQDLQARARRLASGESLLPLHIGSVNPVAARMLRQVADDSGWLTVNIVKRPVLRAAASQYPIAELGIDRLAAIEAVLARRGKDRPDPARHYLVVCAGTATTIDIVRADGLHLGGRILPGMHTGLTAMGDAAALLPKSVALPDWSASEAASNPLMLGQNTVEAMQMGVLAMTVASVRDLLAQLERSGAFAEVHVSGGMGPSLLKLLPDIIYDPNLLLIGLKILALGGLPKNP